MSAQIRCPHCASLLAVLRLDLSKPIVCPKCKQRFQAQITPSLHSVSASSGSSGGLSVALILIGVTVLAAGAILGGGYLWLQFKDAPNPVVAEANVAQAPAPEAAIRSEKDRLDLNEADAARSAAQPPAPPAEEPKPGSAEPAKSDPPSPADVPHPKNPPAPPAPSKEVEEDKPAPQITKEDEQPVPEPPANPVPEEQPRVADNKEPEPPEKLGVLSASPSRSPVREFKRIREVPESQVRAELTKVPDLLINPEWIRQSRVSNRGPLGRLLQSDEKVVKNLEKDTTVLKIPPYVISSETQFKKHLPGLKGELESLFPPDEATELDVLSRKLRRALVKAANKDPLASRAGLFGGDDNRINVSIFRDQIQEQRSEWYRPEAISTLCQILEPETKDLRLFLVEMMRDIPCQKSTDALARMAVFDISPQVREAAIEALRTRPIESYRQKLLDGLMYPWLPAAEHAAEALVALEDRKAVPHLIALLENPKDPRMIYPQDRKDKPSYVQNLVPLESFRGEPLRVEMVKINHLANCLLCHKPTNNPDGTLVSRAPVPGQPLPQGFDVRSPVYYAFGEALVRADVTRLRQDFSVTLTVPDSGAWPGQQRFDYLIMLRPATAKEREEFANLTQPQHHGPVLFALRELTGCDLGPDPRCWAVFKREQGD
jgi:phage FluMu protein Com